TFAGHLGSAVAPVVLLTMTAIWNWRVGVLTSVIVGLVIMLGLATRFNRMHEGVAEQMNKKKKARDEATSIQAPGAAPHDPTTWEIMQQILRSPAIIFLFLFFAM